MRLRILDVAKGFLALTSFLTIIPTGIYDIERASIYFYFIPIVGLIEGLIASTPLLLPIPKLMKVCLVLVTMYLITGFNHIDGFEDFVDAIASGKHGEEALRVMKDSSRGSIAVAATILLIITNFSAVYSLEMSLDTYQLVLTLITTHILSAESMFILSSISREPPYKGLGRLFIIHAKKLRSITMNALLASICLLTVIQAGIAQHLVLLMLVPTPISILVTYRLAHRVLGFTSGDVLGFCFELVRATTLVLLSCIIYLA